MYNSSYGINGTNNQLKSSEFNPVLTLYSYKVLYMGKIYPDFTRLGPVFGDYVLTPFFPLPITASNPYFNGLEMMNVKGSFALMNSSFEPPCGGYCNIDSKILDTLMPTVNSNDIIYHNKGHGSNLKISKENQLMIYQCDICRKVFNRKYVLERHRGLHSNKWEYHCKPCDIGFYRKDVYDRHLATKKCMKAHKII